MVNPIDGFQRLFDKRRAQEIADYIDKGFGTIPGSIVLSAQPGKASIHQKDKNTQVPEDAEVLLDYRWPESRLWLQACEVPLRVPVVIYNGLSRADEARLFMDVNTKQRPVPPELILDIKRLAETETDVEALLQDIYYFFNSSPDSPCRVYWLLQIGRRASYRASPLTMHCGPSGMRFQIAMRNRYTKFLAHIFAHSWLAYARRERSTT